MGQPQGWCLLRDRYPRAKERKGGGHVSSFSSSDFYWEPPEMSLPLSGSGGHSSLGVPLRVLIRESREARIFIGWGETSVIKSFSLRIGRRDQEGHLP